MIVRASDNYCVMCGEIIPEGRQVCPICEKSVLTQSTNDNWQDDIKKYIADYINQAIVKGFRVSEVYQDLHKFVDMAISEYKINEVYKGE